jgi:hypothetical protein
VAGTNRRDILSKNPYEELRAGDTLGEVEETMEGPESEKGTESEKAAGYGRYTRGMGRLGLPKQYSYTLGDSVASAQGSVGVPTKDTGEAAPANVETTLHVPSTRRRVCQ